MAKTVITPVNPKKDKPKVGKKWKFVHNDYNKEREARSKSKSKKPKTKITLRSSKYWNRYYKVDFEVGSLLVLSKFIRILRLLRDLVPKPNSAITGVNYRITKTAILLLRNYYGQLLRKVLFKSVKLAAYRSGYKKWININVADNTLISHNKNLRFRILPRDVYSALGICNDREPFLSIAEEIPKQKKKPTKKTRTGSPIKETEPLLSIAEEKPKPKKKNTKKTTTTESSIKETII